MSGLRPGGRGDRAPARPRRHRGAGPPARDDAKARRAYILAHPPGWTNTLRVGGARGWAGNATYAPTTEAQPGAASPSPATRADARRPQSPRGAPQWDVYSPPR